jgi:septum site-determining protein MinD
MAKIVSIHSFRGGTGKSNATANIAALLAMEGQRVGVVDADIQSPGVHVIFGVDQSGLTYTLNDYLWERCAIEQAAHDVTPGPQGQISGRIYLVPSSMKTTDITRLLREGYDVGALQKGLRVLIDALNLDVLMIDTHPGLDEETMLSIAMSHALAIVLRPDQQDYEGTAVTVQVARRLKVPRLLLLVNKVPAAFDSAEVRARVEAAYDCEVAAVLPHSDTLMALSSRGIFVLEYTEDPMTELYRQAAAKIVA